MKNLKANTYKDESCNLIGRRRPFVNIVYTKSFCFGCVITMGDGTLFSTIKLDIKGT